MSARGGNARHALRPAHVAAALAASALSVLFFSSSGHDDCHITFWAAYGLAEFGELVNHSGARLEQSSSLLHTLLLAVAYGATGAPMAWLAWTLGIAAAMGAVLRLPALARALDFELGPGAALVIATSPAFAYWQLGMLEGSLVSLCAVEFLIRTVRWLTPGGGGLGALVALALSSAALVAVRPEGGLVALCVALALLPAPLLRRSSAPRAASPEAGAAWVLVGTVGSLLAASVVARLAVFGAPFPHPVSAKIGGGGPFLETVATGLGYLLERLGNAGGAVLVMGLVAGLAVGWVDLRAGRTQRVAPLLFVGAYLGFVVTAGGDWMKAWRFVAHVELLIPFLLFAALSRTSPGRRLRRVLVAGLVAVQAAGMLALGAGFGTGMPLWTAWQQDPAVRAFAPADVPWPERANQVHARDVLMVDDMNRVLERLLAVQARVSILTKQGGLVPYYAAKEHYGSIEVLDLFGIVSAHYEETRARFDLHTGQKGISWSMRDFFTLAAHEDDPRFHPDVVFDIHQSTADYLREKGYVVVYEQFGELSGRYTTPADVLLQDIRWPDPEPPPRGPFEERFRQRVHEKPVEAPSFWSSTTDVYQYVAVRAELAEAAGLVDAEAGSERLGRWPEASRHRLIWSRARRWYLRYLLGERPADLREPPAELPAASPFRSSATSDRGGAALYHIDPEGLLPSNLQVDEIRLGARVLGEQDGCRVQSPKDKPRLVLPARAGLREGDVIEVRGLAASPEPLDLRGHFTARQP